VPGLEYLLMPFAKYVGWWTNNWCARFAINNRKVFNKITFRKKTILAHQLFVYVRSYE